MCFCVCNGFAVWFLVATCLLCFVVSFLCGVSLLVLFVGFDVRFVYGFRVVL